MRTDESWWDQLLAFLDERGSAAEVAPGRIRVRLEGSDRELEIVMTEDEWDDMAGVMWGSVDDAAHHLVGIAATAGPEDHFLVYQHYTVEPSPTAELPVDPDLARVRQMLRDRPEGVGGWFATNEDGRLTDRFADFPDD